MLSSNEQQLSVTTAKKKATISCLLSINSRLVNKCNDKLLNTDTYVAVLKARYFPQGLVKTKTEQNGKSVLDLHSSGG